MRMSCLPRTVPPPPGPTADVRPPVTSSGSSGAKVPVPVSVIVEPSNASAEAELIPHINRVSSLARTLPSVASNENTAMTNPRNKSALAFMVVSSVLNWVTCSALYMGKDTRSRGFPGLEVLVRLSRSPPPLHQPDAHLAAKADGGTIEKQRTAGSVLTACLTRGANPKQNRQTCLFPRRWRHETKDQLTYPHKNSLLCPHSKALDPYPSH